MNIYIWKYVGQLTYNYHSGGGLVIVAKSLQRAYEMIEADEYIKLDLKDEAYPTYTYALAGEAPEQLIKFPDAGCC